MKILFATGNPYMPEAYGGMQTSADELCRALMRRDHQVAILSRFRRKGLFGMLMAAQKFVYGARFRATPVMATRSGDHDSRGSKSSMS